MDIANVISCEDLGKPYLRLAGFLNIAEISLLAENYGGRQIRFNKPAEIILDGHPELIAMFGEEKARKIIAAFHGGKYYFPQLRRNCRGKVIAAIKKEFTGCNYSELAAKYGYTDRHIRRLLNDKPGNPFYDESQLMLEDM